MKIYREAELTAEYVMIHFDDALVPEEEAADLFAGAQGHV